MRVTYPVHLILLHSVALIISDEGTDYEAPHYEIFSKLFYFISLRSQQLVFKFNLCSFLIMRDKFSNQYKTTGKIIGFQIFSSLYLRHKPKNYIKINSELHIRLILKNCNKLYLRINILMQNKLLYRWMKYVKNMTAVRRITWFNSVVIDQAKVV
jgi:hypothetical protein